MTAPEVIYFLLSHNSAVTDIVGENIFPLYAPQTFEAPFVTFQLVDNRPSNTKSGASETDMLLYQINCVGKTHDSTFELKEAVRYALDYQYMSKVTHISFQGERGMWDSRAQLQGSTAFAQDYLIRYNRYSHPPVFLITQAEEKLITQDGKYLITQ